jgi:hypothetical protein
MLRIFLQNDDTHETGSWDHHEPVPVDKLAEQRYRP